MISKRIFFSLLSAFLFLGLLAVPPGGTDRALADGLKVGVGADGFSGSLNAFENAIGQPTDIFLIYQSIDSVFPAGDLLPIAQSGHIIQLSFEPHLSWGDPVSQPDYSLKRIAQGVHDAEIRQWARTLRDFGYPIRLRPMCEMNGNWASWGGTVNGNQPQDYIPAWRHMHDIFVQEGATNVAWDWSPNRDSSYADAQATFNDYYPGDAYVDFVGINGYNWGSYFPEFGFPPWQDFTWVFANSYDVFSAGAPSKPIMISETASPEGSWDGQKAAWISDMFNQLPARFPRVESVTWFNYPVWTHSGWSYSWQVQSSASSIAAFRDGVASSSTPQVSISIPADGSLVSGPVYVQADIVNNVFISKVDFYVDDQLAFTDNAAPFVYIWDTSALSGSHTVKAIASNAAGYPSSPAASHLTVDRFTPSDSYLFTWYDQSNPEWRDWVLLANPAAGAGAARSEVRIGGYTMAGNDMAAGAPAYTPQFPGIMSGPVAVTSTRPLITSQRVLYKNSFNEVPGVSEDDLDTTYYFTWYDSQLADGFSGDWILISNQGDADANVDVYIGGVLKGNYTVPAGGRITPSYPGLTAGPVKVVSNNGQPLMVSQRVIYKDSFSEVLGMPASKLSSQYEFTWYDDKPANFMKGNWILISNQDSGTADVDVFIGGARMGSYSIPQGGIISPQYYDLMSGPVKVVSTNGKKLLVSQRILFKDSFEELQGLTGSDAGTDLWFTWYDSMWGNGMRGNWVLVANTAGQKANVDIYIGSTKMGSYAVPAGGEITPLYPDTMAGPVRVLSTNGVPVLATQRVVYLDSFNEIAGIKY